MGPDAVGAASGQPTPHTSSCGAVAPLALGVSCAQLQARRPVQLTGLSALRRGAGRQEASREEGAWGRLASSEGAE